MTNLKALYNNPKVQKIFWGIVVGIGVATGLFKLNQAQQDSLLQSIMGMFQ